MLLTGGSAVASSLSGVPTPAACFLLPVGVVLYTIFGGIKATFLTDYVHTICIMTVLFIFGFTAYATSDLLGSPGAVWEKLMEACCFILVLKKSVSADETIFDLGFRATPGRRKCEGKLSYHEVSRGRHLLSVSYVRPGS